MVRKMRNKIEYGSIEPIRLVNGQKEVKVVKMNTLAAERRKSQTKQYRFHKSRAKRMAFVSDTDLEPVPQELVLEINSLIKGKPSILGRLKLIGKHINSAALRKKGKIIR